MSYTRDDLIEICERAVVPESKWHDRDSQKSQYKVGALWALLKAGCEFEIVVDDPVLKGEGETIWVRVWSRGFAHFDYDGELENDIFYLPTPLRLMRSEGKDWY